MIKDPRWRSGRADAQLRCSCLSLLNKASLQRSPPSTERVLEVGGLMAWSGLALPRRCFFSAPYHITHGLMSWYVTCWW